jgi:cytochrome c-type biogenesis protein CcmH
MREVEPRRHEDTKPRARAPAARQSQSSRLRVFVVQTLVFLFVVLAAPAFAVLPSERLADPVLEGRARALSQELRCLVCQNQSIDDSSADLAHDLRVLVRERLAAGDSDRQVLAYLTSRYGDYVLLRPPVKPTTWLLWFGPPALLLAGLAGIIGGVVAAGRRRRSSLAAETAALNEHERRRLVDLMKKGAVR